MIERDDNSSSKQQEIDLMIYMHMYIYCSIVKNTVSKIYTVSVKEK